VESSYDIVWLFPDGTKRSLGGYRQLNLLGHSEIYELGIPQACGGQAECGTCRIRLIKGELTAPTAPEKELTERHRKRFQGQERLACQGRPRSDLIVELLGIMPPDLRHNDG
jgi:ferredoxin